MFISTELLVLYFLSDTMESAFKMLMQNDKISFKEGLQFLRKNMKGNNISSPTNISRTTSEIMKLTERTNKVDTIYFDSAETEEVDEIRRSVVQKGILNRITR